MRRTASTGAGFWLTALAFTIVMVGTTLPTPLYPGYEQRFGFGSLTVTIVFATYAVGVLTALLLVGRASDTIGRRPVLFGGLVAAGLSSVLFVAIASMHSGGLAALLIGRFLSGLSAGIFTGTATATLSDLAGRRSPLRASLVAAVANIGGLGLGPLLAGVLAKWVAAPLRTCYVVHLVLLVIAAAAIAVIAEPVSVSGPRRLQVQRLAVPDQARATLARSGTAGFAGFAVLGLFTAVTPSALALLGHHNPALTGLVVLVVFASSAIGQVASAALTPTRSLLIGIGILVVGMAGIGLALSQKSLAFLVMGGIIAGLGQGLSFRAALGAVTQASPAAQRGAVASTFFAICYIGISLPVVGVGAGTKAYGLVHTGETFAGIVALLCLAALVSVARAQPASK